jgi:isochorismate hydrolase
LFLTLYPQRTDVKEAYFTPHNLAEKSRAMLAELEPLCQRHAGQTFAPGLAALLVLDMQAYFLQAVSHAFVPSAAAILPNVARLAEIFSGFNQPIFFTRHVNTDADAGSMAAWWRDLLRPDAPESLIVPALDTSRGTVLRKNQYDAFHETALENELRRLGVEQVVVTGVMTHLCCETTARSAFMRGFQVFFCVDGTATYTEAFHRAALLNLAHGFSRPMLCGEIAGAFGGSDF